jgi:2-succinyl-6-hydroxy-2,4-cyclohexadiene-1-carboxylate synthase
MAPDVVLLHGFTHTGASWDPVVAALAERYRALTPDLRGHGSASDRIPVSLEPVLDDIAALAPATFTLAGYSMGGRIALHAALVLGARIDRLVLIGASPGIADPSERAARRAADERLADEIEGSTIEQFAERWAQTPVLAGQPAGVAAAARADRLRSTPDGLARALRGLGTGALPSLWERLPEIEMPVALIVGERDQRFGDIAREMAARLNSAEIVVVPGAGHAVHLEAPAAVAETISRARQPGGWPARPARTERRRRRGASP